jgi:putative colanic acid biosynthesis acetyltransferase WcaF
MSDTPRALNLDLAANQAARKFSLREQILRVLWSGGRVLFWLTPKPFFSVRRGLLRLFGARVGNHARVAASAVVYMPWNVELGEWSAVGDNVLIYSVGKVRIGKGATVSYRAHVCAGAHDFDDPALALTKPPVVIEDDAWIGTEAFIAPDVTIGYGAVVGARAVVLKDVPPLNVVSGNPARTVALRKPSQAPAQVG